MLRVGLKSQKSGKKKRKNHCSKFFLCLNGIGSISIVPGMQIQFPAWHSGFKDPGLLQLWHRLQLQLGSDPWPGNSLCCRAAKKEKKKKESFFKFSLTKCFLSLGCRKKTYANKGHKCNVVLNLKNISFLVIVQYFYVISTESELTDIRHLNCFFFFLL